MSRVGIRAPLEHSEETWSVLGLAERLRVLGHECSWFPRQHPRDEAENYGWRGEVLRRGRFSDWCADQDLVISTQIQMCELMTTVRRGVRSLLLWLPRGYSRLSTPLWQCYDDVLAPTQTAYEGLLRTAPRVKATRLLWVAEGPPICQRTFEWQYRVLVPVSGRTARCWGPALCYLLEMLLTRVPCQLLLAIVGSWPRPCQFALRDLVRQKRGRVEVLRHPSRSRFLAAMAMADVMFAPDASSWAGWPVLDALWAGMPVVALRISPFTEMVVPERHGYLIPCSYVCHGDGMTEAVVDRRFVLEALEEVLRPERVRRWLGTQPWCEMSNRIAAFDEWLVREGWLRTRPRAGC